MSDFFPFVDFLQTADFMREELQKFFIVVRRGPHTEAIRQATEQLQHALSRCQTFASDSDQRDNLPVEQRWGFLLLLSHVQSAREALKQVCLHNPGESQNDPHLKR